MSAHRMPADEIHPLRELCLKFFGEIILHAGDVCQHGILLQKSDLLFNECHRPLFRCAENDDICVFQILFGDRIHDPHPKCFLRDTCRAVDPDDAAADGLETFGKGAAHQSKADDGDRKVAKVVIAVHVCALFC